MRFLVVYEDEWNNKYSYPTNKIGDTITKITQDFEIEVDCDIEKLNSDDPYDMGTFGRGFYDIDVFIRDGVDPEEYLDTLAGRIMIFETEEENE